MGQRIRMKPKPPYTRCYRDRHGKLRWEFRKKGCKGRPLPGSPGSDEFWEAYDAALKGAEAPHSVGASLTVHGSINALVARFCGPHTPPARSMDPMGRGWLSDTGTMLPA